MNIRRGTTPTIVMNVLDDLDLSRIVEIWVYFSQQNKVKIDKGENDVVMDYDNRKMRVLLSQEDTLNLKEGEAIFQVRALLDDGTALASKDSKVKVLQVYKGGVITNE